jgi:rRNA maturation protein Rpf1
MEAIAEGKEGVVVVGDGDGGELALHDFAREHNYFRFILAEHNTNHHP